MPGRSSSSPFARSTRSSDGGSIRCFARADLDQVLALWMRCFRHQEMPTPDALRRYFIDVLLESPWYDAELAPLVLEHHGEIAGFIGRMARPMLFNGRPIRCAVATQLMVDPRRKLGFAALELVRAVQAGPQDLCYSDGANENSLAVWQRCGGRAPKLLSLEWTRPLRPMSWLNLRLREHPGRLSRIASLAAPATGMADAVALSVLPGVFHRPMARLERQVAGAEQILPLLQQAAAAAQLQPVYTAESYRWLLEIVAQAQSFGRLRSVVVLDEGQPMGWFIYFVQRGGYARVVQAGAVYGQGPAVFSELCRDAWENQAAVITGQVDPAMLTVVSNSHATLRSTHLGVLVHARDPDLLAAVERGDGFLSRMEGEWWMRFGIDRARW